VSVCFLCGSLCGLLVAALCGPPCGGPLLCGPLCGSSRRLLLTAFCSAFLRHSFSVICLSFAASAAVLSHILCNILHDITAYCTCRPSFEVFEVFGEVFIYFRGRILDFGNGNGETGMGRSRCLKKKTFSPNGKGAHYSLLHIIVQYQYPPLSPPLHLYCLQHCAIYFPHTSPFIDFCNKILTISSCGVVVL